MKSYGVSLKPNEFFSSSIFAWYICFSACYRITFDNFLLNLVFGHLLETDKKKWKYGSISVNEKIVSDKNM